MNVIRWRWVVDKWVGTMWRDGVELPSAPYDVWVSAPSERIS